MTRLSYFEVHVIWLLGLEAYRKAARDSALRDRIKAAKQRYEFFQKLGDSALDEMAGYPRPRIELPNLHAEPNLRVSGLLLAAEYGADLRKAKNLWPELGRINRNDRRRERLRESFPSLLEKDFPECSSPSATAYLSVAGKYSLAVGTVKRRVRTLPKTSESFRAYFSEEARTWTGDEETIQRVRKLGYEVNLRDLRRLVKKLGYEAGPGI